MPRLASALLPLGLLVASCTPQMIRPTPIPATPTPPSATASSHPATPEIHVVTPIAFPTDSPSPPPTASSAARPPAEVQPGAQWQAPVDAMPMVYVPAGPFWMGSLDDRQADFDERPFHRPVLSAFWIDRTEVTNDMYLRCIAAGACSPPPNLASATRPSYFADPAYGDYPVIFVSWQQASAYCAWAGRRLPSEAEWEKAARGGDGRIYPWGWIAALKSPKGLRLNYCDSQCPYDYRDAEADDGYADTAPVGSFPAGASPYGALDMAGNVWEWVADWYDAQAYAAAPAEDPAGPETGVYHVLRGGSWLDLFSEVRAANRFWAEPSAQQAHVGFRCALDG